MEWLLALGIMWRITVNSGKNMNIKSIKEHTEWALTEIEQVAGNLVLSDSEQADRLFKALDILKPALRRKNGLRTR